MNSQLKSSDAGHSPSTGHSVSCPGQVAVSRTCPTNRTIQQGHSELRFRRDWVRRKRCEVCATHGLLRKKEVEREQVSSSLDLAPLPLPPQAQHHVLDRFCGFPFVSEGVQRECVQKRRVLHYTERLLYVLLRENTVPTIAVEMTDPS